MEKIYDHWKAEIMENLARQLPRLDIIGNGGAKARICPGSRRDLKSCRIDALAESGPSVGRGGPEAGIVLGPNPKSLKNGNLIESGPNVERGWPRSQSLARQSPRSESIKKQPSGCVWATSCERRPTSRNLAQKSPRPENIKDLVESGPSVARGCPEV